MNLFFKNNNKENGTEQININEYAGQIRWDTKFKIVNLEEYSDPVNFETLLKIAEDMDSDIFIVNEKNDPKIVKIIDMQKYTYELKKSKKEQEKRRKAQVVKTKEIRISLSISEHDLDIKIKHAKEFLDEGNKVKFILKLRGREGSGDAGQKYVRDYFDSIIEKFKNSNCDKMSQSDKMSQQVSQQYNFEKVKMMGGNIWTEITK